MMPTLICFTDPPGKPLRTKNEIMSHNAPRTKRNPEYNADAKSEVPADSPLAGRIISHE
jgi:hypothetical protein